MTADSSRCPPRQSRLVASNRALDPEAIGETRPPPSRRSAASPCGTDARPARAANSRGALQIEGQDQHLAPFQHRQQVTTLAARERPQPERCRDGPRIGIAQLPDDENAASSRRRRQRPADEPDRTPTAAAPATGRYASVPWRTSPGRRDHIETDSARAHRDLRAATSAQHGGAIPIGAFTKNTARHPITSDERAAEDESPDESNRCRRAVQPIARFRAGPSGKLVARRASAVGAITAAPIP